MTFSYGYMVAALNHPEEPRYQRYRYSTNKQQAVDPKLALSLTKSFEYREPCHEPEGREESELCAEWRAAKAGEDSAFWAKWSVGVGGAGLLGLLISLKYTRRAVKIASDATKDADDALEIARLAAEATVNLVKVSERNSADSLRAYVFPSGVAWAIRNPGSLQDGFIDFRITWTNFGQTPPQLLEITAGGIVTKDTNPPHEILNGQTHLLGLAPKGSINSTYFRVSAEDLQNIFEGENHLFLIGEVRYRDLFSDEIRNFKYCYSIILLCNPGTSTGWPNYIDVNWVIVGPHNSA